jgi:hypothetical protein
VDDPTEIGYRTLPPHDYLTQDLANGKVRIFALEEVVTDYDDYDNLRAVATLDWDYGQDLCDFLKDVLFEIDKAAGRIDGHQTPDPAQPMSAGRPSAEARVRAVQQLTAPGTRWPVLEAVISFCRPPVPNAVATAVFADLARQGIDVAAVAVTLSSTSTAESVGE